MARAELQVDEIRVYPEGATAQAVDGKLTVTLQAVQVPSLTLTAVSVRPGLGDTDGDGISDLWEWGQGFSLNDPSDALLDFDGDKVSNLHEYVAGTDPLNASDVFRVSAQEVMPGGGIVTLRFKVIPQRIYEVEATSTLGGGWTTVQTVHPTAPGTAEVNLPTSGNTLRFWRARVIVER